jgi:hypothetical protein
MSTSTVAGLTAATISDELGALEPPVKDDHHDDHRDQRNGARDARDDHRPVDRAAEHHALDARRRRRSAPGGGCTDASTRRCGGSGRALGRRRGRRGRLLRLGGDAVEEVQLGVADADPFAAAQRHRAGDAPAVDEGAVGRAQVLEHDGAVGLRSKQRVTARGLAVGEGQLAVRAAADEKRPPATSAA